jgi:hypothetical protein
VTSRSLVAAAVGLALAAGVSWGEWLEVDGSIGEGYRMGVVGEGDGWVEVEFRLGRLWTEEVEVEGEAYTRLYVPGGSLVLERGVPEVPYVVGSVVVSDRGGVRMEVVEEEWEEVELGVVVPSKGNLLRSVDPATVPYEFGVAYEGRYPGIGVELGEPFVVRDFRGVSVKVWPVEAGGYGGMERLLRRVVVRVESGGGVGVNEKEVERGGMAREFVPIYERMFLNWGRVSRQNYVDELPGGMLVIVADGYYNDVLPLVEWKTQKGLEVELKKVSEIGNDWNTIDAYIESRYYATGNLVHVLLVGSANDVKPYGWTGTGNSPQDPLYVLIEGGDDYADAFIGRFAADGQSNVVTQVERNIEYEKTPMVIGGDWWGHGLGIASNQASGGPTDRERVTIELMMLLGFTYTDVDSVYDPGATASAVSASLNDGVSMTLYMGHGAPSSWGTSGFGNGNIDALTNHNKLSIAHSVACNTGQFDDYTCMGEKWVWATDGGEPTGGIAFYGSVVGQSWNPPTYAQWGMVHFLTDWQYNTIGGIVFNGAIYMVETQGSSGYEEYRYWILFGDPSVQFRSAQPSMMPSVVHLPVVAFGSTSFDVEVTGLEGALCALTKDGVLYGSGYTGADGTVQIVFNQPVSDPGQMHLVVTAFNRVPWIEDIPVGQLNGPYLMYSAHQVDDDAVQSAGDGDGVVEQGETVELGVKLWNAGNQAATGIGGVLRTADGCVSVTDSVESWLDIAAGDTGWCVEDYDVVVAGGVPDNHAVPFGLEITSGDSVWLRGFSVVVRSPVLVYGGHSVDDAGGNGNGRWDPGETVDLEVTVANNGGGDARSVTGTLSESDPLVDVLSGGSSFADIGPGGSSSGTFQVSADGACPEGYTVTFQLDLDAQGPWSGTVSFDAVVGQPPVLFVDSDDETHETRLVDALDASGWGYDTWQAFAQGSVPLDTLRKYQVIVWTGGDQNTQSMSSTDRINLGVYLEEGGSLFLTAENYLSAYGSEMFTSDYLHVSSYTTNVTVDSVIGVAGDPIGDGLRVATDFPSGLSEYPDEIVPQVTAAGMLRNGDGGPFVALRYPGAMGSSNYRVVFMVVPFEALEPGAVESGPQLFFDRNLCWLSGDTQAPSELTDVTAVVSPPDGVTLSWSPAWDNTGVYCYRVYRGTQGYFAPGAGTLLATVTGTGYTDTGAAGDPGVNYYYVVTALDVLGNESGPSNRVGEIDFGTAATR